MSSEYNRSVDLCAGIMPPGLDFWIREHSLEQIFAPNLYTTVVWIKNCLFPSASTETQAITCMDLGLWFYFLDDYVGEDDLSVFDVCVKLIDDGKVPETNVPSHFPTEAYLDVMARAASLPGYADDYLRSRRDLVSWYIWRNPANRSLKNVSYHDYHRCRQSTIYIRQWLALMCCFRDCHPRGEMAPLLEDLVDTLIEWHILINELASIEKDRARGENNLIILQARDNGVSLNSAIAESLQSLTDATTRYKQKFLHLSSRAQDQWMRDYLEIIDSSIVGALRTYHENAKRYQASFGHLVLPPAIW